jgi:hypothetical protein
VDGSVQMTGVGIVIPWYVLLALVVLGLLWRRRRP